MKKPHSISVTLSLAFIAVVLFLAVFADFIANDRPIIAVHKEKGMGFFDRIEHPEDYTTLIYPMIRYKGGLDLENTTTPPFSHATHYLGTDHLGRDVLAGLIHGSRTSLGISLLAIVVASLIGILLGGSAGFLGDDGMRVSYFSLGALVLLVMLFHYFVIMLNGEFGWWALSVAVSFPVYLQLRKKADRAHGIKVPLDMWVLKFMEVFSSVPGYFLILALVAFIDPNWLVFAIIIGASSWVGIARLARGEMIRVRSTGYIESARALGLSQARTFFRHALPNAVGPLPYAITFGVASIIVVESTLSYFGIGLPADSISWGNFLSGFKNNPSNWWIALFPGMMIFTTILCLHRLGRWLEAIYHPSNRVTDQSS